MGEVIQWYKPKPKANLEPVEAEVVVEETEEEHAAFVKETLEKVLKDAPYIQDVLILIKNKHDEIAFVSSMEGLEQNYMFMARMKKRMLELYDDKGYTPPPKVG